MNYIGNRKVFMFVILFAVMLVGCKDSKLSEKEISSNLPSEFSEISVLSGDQTEYYDLALDEFVIRKRQTNEKDDTIYCTITEVDSNYTYTIDCVLYFNYYDQGGWILDNYEIEQSSIQPSAAVDQSVSDYDVSCYYDDFEFQDCEYDESDRTAHYTYTVKDKDVYLSREGKVQLDYNFCDYGNNAEWKLDCVDESGIRDIWDIEGTWIGEEDTKGYGYYQLNFVLSDYNSEDLTVDVQGSETYFRFMYEWDENGDGVYKKEGPDEFATTGLYNLEETYGFNNGYLANSEFLEKIEEGDISTDSADPQKCLTFEIDSYTSFRILIFSDHAVWKCYSGNSGEVRRE